jgi:hypothetical protein
VSRPVEEALLAIIRLLVHHPIIAVLWAGLALAVGVLARTYRRDPIAWTILSLIFTPVAGFTFLFVAGVPHEVVKRAAQAALLRKIRPEASEAEIEELVRHESQCPYCNARLNPATGEGVSPAEEGNDWEMLCASCGEKLPPDLLG